MSTTYTGANTFPASITIPSDGDAKSAASVNVAFEGLADRTANLQGYLNGTNATPVLKTPILEKPRAHLDFLIHGDAAFAPYFVVAPEVNPGLYLVQTLSAPGQYRLSDAVSFVKKGNTAEFSFRGMAGGQTIEIRNDDGATLLLTCTATSNCYSKWLRVSDPTVPLGWLLMHSADK